MNDFNNSPFFNNTGMDIIQPGQSLQQNQIIQTVPRPQYSDTSANIKTGGFKFTVRKDNEPSRTPLDLSIVNDIPTEVKKRRGRPRKTEVDGNSIVRDQKSNDEETSALSTYEETTNMLKGTLLQIDQLSAQIKQEFDSVSSNRTLKNKYSTMADLSENLVSLVNAKINAISKINDAISKSNDLDYKREKDRRAIQSNVNDDKYLMDMYNAFIQNPSGLNNRAMLGPSSIDATLAGDNIVRVADNQLQQQDAFNPDNGYLSYVANMTPEQRLMAIEDNPNIKMCVVFDASTGNKVFQMMDMSTGQAVPGLPVRDQMFMEDTTIDIKNHIAKNINLNETYPLVIINENVVKEY